MTVAGYIERRLFTPEPEATVTPPATKAVGWRTLEIPGSGAPLAALFGRALSGRAKGTIVCAHPLLQHGKRYFLDHGHAGLLRHSGYNVLLFDFHGFGDSPADAGSFADDIVAAGRMALALEPDAAPALLAVSFGAAWALRALGSERHPFRAAVLESAYARLEAYPLGSSWQRILAHCAAHCLPGLRVALSPILHIPAIRTVENLLFVHGELDNRTPASVGRQLLKACERQWKPHTSEPEWFRFPTVRSGFWLVPGAGHAEALQVAPRAYIEKVVGFFDSALAG